MSEFDNQYLCPLCSHIGLIESDDMVCGKCSYDCCFVAKHVNEGTRKYWMKKEESLANWRYDKKFTIMMKNATPDDTQLVKFFIKSVKELFTGFVENKNNLDDYFPKYVRDYKRTTGRRETGWKAKGSKSVLKQKQSSLRGAIYEGAMVKFCEEHDFFEPILVPIPYYDKQEDIHTDYEPDFWFNFEGRQIPIEFKTYGKQNMVKSKFKKGIKQSRHYGHLSTFKVNNPEKLSGMIVCCPEERKYSCAIIDDRAKRL